MLPRGRWFHESCCSLKRLLPESEQKLSENKAGYANESAQNLIDY